MEQRSDDRATLRSRAPLNDGPGRTRGVFALGPEQSGQSFDVGPWPGSAEPALYEFTERDNGVEVTVHPSPGDTRSPLRFRAAVPDIAGRGFSELRIATWNGPQPDLFAISCPSPTERCQLRIFSGESDFRRQLEILRLPLFAKRKKDWTLDFAGGPNADLFLIRHQADRNHTEVKVALRNSDFRGISFRREIDLPGQVNPMANFLAGTSGDAPAVYFVTPEKRGSESRVSVFPILLPVGLE